MLRSNLGLLASLSEFIQKTTLSPMDTLIVFGMVLTTCCLDASAFSGGCTLSSTPQMEGSGPTPAAQRLSRNLDEHDTKKDLRSMRLYVLQGCPFCDKVLKFCADNDIEMVVVDIHEDRDARDRLIKLGGKPQVPALDFSSSCLPSSCLPSSCLLSSSLPYLEGEGDREDILIKTFVQPPILYESDAIIQELKMLLVSSDDIEAVD